MRAGVGEQVLFQNKFKCVCSKMTIVQREPVSPCIPMVECGLATAQIARKQVSNTEITGGSRGGGVTGVTGPPFNL